VRRLLPICVCAALVLAGCGGGGDHEIDAQVRAAGFTFAPEVSAGDRAWIEAAVLKVRPEARQLIEDVDGMVTITTFDEPDGPAVGLTQPLPDGRFTVGFNVAYLDGDRQIDRDVTVAHELGHVIDFAVVPDDLEGQLTAGLPTSGACYTAETGDCTAPEERFADTFAKWALRGAVSAIGAGYAVLSPASLEDWGAPLSKLAIDIEVASR
jgi:hypothetical protein